jgi:hypothetical protein
VRIIGRSRLPGGLADCNKKEDKPMLTVTEELPRVLGDRSLLAVEAPPAPPETPETETPREPEPPAPPPAPPDPEPEPRR